DVSFTVHPGQTVALVGPSGGGKSSIVSLIEHFYECDKGCVLIDGNPVADYDHEYIHQKIALVAQDPILYEGTVRDNIVYGCDWATEEDVLNAAKIANAHNFIMETEKQYDTNCGEKGVQLSGGQKQRIAIARALVRHPAILILDEATSALDAESEHVIQDAIAQCSKDKTVIVIAHRLSTVENADQIIVINKGRVVQQGRHDDLLEQDGIYRALVHRQLLGHSSSKYTELCFTIRNAYFHTLENSSFDVNVCVDLDLSDY
ncbi:ATP-binding cassette sub-family B member 9, partial [Wuchereria bancrofti]